VCGRGPQNSGMATYAIGDVQGCYGAFERLLERIAFAPQAGDRLWLCGDLVNRGPRSLEMLRFAHAHQDSVVTVLGNHEMALLGHVEGVAPLRGGHTLRAVLEAPDCEELCAWLHTVPFVHADARFLLVHAGLLPEWTCEQALALAAEASAALQDPQRRPWLLRVLRRARTAPDPKSRPEMEPLWRALDAFTTLRTCTLDGAPGQAFVGPPEQAPADLLPWFAVPGRRGTGRVILFGHWAGLGLRMAEDWIALDSGCVWGGSLTAVRLDDRAVFQQPALAEETSTKVKTFRDVPPA